MPRRSDARAVSISTAGYQDGLGRRSVRFDREVGGMLECLHLRPELWAFEANLRERAGAIAALDDERFVRMRAIERDAHGLVVVSELVAGQRLHDVIDIRQRDDSTGFGLDAAFGFLLQALPALSVLHGAAITLGTLALGRIVVTPSAQVVLLDGIYGAAVERLKLNRRALWTSLGILAPASAGAARLDHRTDVAQAAICALILALGRLVDGAAGPSALAPLVREVSELAEIRAGAAFAASVQTFFAATLPLGGHQPAMTSDEAAVRARLIANAIGEEASHAAFADLTRLDSTARFAAPALFEADDEPLEEPIEERIEDTVEAPIDRPLGRPLPILSAPEPALRPVPPKPALRPVPPKPVPAPSPVVIAPAAAPAAVTPPPVAPPAPLLPAAPAAAPVCPPAPALIPAPVPAAPPAPVAAPPAPLPFVPRPAPPAPLPVVPITFAPAAAPAAATAIRLATVAPPIAVAPAPPAPAAIVAAPPAVLRVRIEPPSGYTPTREEPALSMRALPTIDRGVPTPAAGFPRKLAGAALIILVTGILVGREYLPDSSTASAATAAPSVTEPTPALSSLPAAPRPRPGTTGSLMIESQPAGARVSIDGVDVGVTPLKLDAVAVGRHTVAVTTATASVNRSVRVEADRLISVDIPVYSGWISVFSPIPLEIAVAGKTIGNTDTGKILLPPGRHVVTLSNRELNFRQTREVEIHPGEERPLSIEPKGRVNINAHPWAEVWVDGRKVGETPIANLQVLLGTRVFVFRHPQYGDRRLTETITSAGAAFSIDLTKPGSIP